MNNGNGGRNEKENGHQEWRAGVLSPRVTGVVGKSGGVRRMTMMGVSEERRGDRAERGHQGTTGLGVGHGHVHQRMSSVNGNAHGNGGSRGSLMPGGKGVWR